MTDASGAGNTKRSSLPIRRFFGWLFAAPDRTIAAALFMGAIAALGWLIAHIITVHDDESNRRVTWELDHIGRKLELLYGPLYFQIEEGRAASKQFHTIFNHLYGRASVFIITNGKDPGDPDAEVRTLKDDEWNTWITWTEKEFLPRNREIAKILQSRADLVEGEGLLAPYKEFLSHLEASRLIGETGRRLTGGSCGGLGLIGRRVLR